MDSELDLGYSMDSNSELTKDALMGRGSVIHSEGSTAPSLGSQTEPGSESNSEEVKALE